MLATMSVGDPNPLRITKPLPIIPKPFPQTLTSLVRNATSQRKTWKTWRRTKFKLTGEFLAITVGRGLLEWRDWENTLFLIKNAASIVWHEQNIDILSQFHFCIWQHLEQIWQLSWILWSSFCGVKMAICCPQARGTLRHWSLSIHNVVPKLSQNWFKVVSNLSQSCPKSFQVVLKCCSHSSQVLCM